MILAINIFPICSGTKKIASIFLVFKKSANFIQILETKLMAPYYKDTLQIVVKTKFQ